VNGKYRVAVGIYPTEIDVEIAFSELKLSGFPVADISILISATGREEALLAQVPTAAEVTAGLAGPNTTPDAALRWLMEIGAWAVLTTGSIIAAGPIAAALVQSGVDGRAGDLATALVALGIRKHEAKFCERRVMQGGFLVSVCACDPDWCRLGAKLLHRTGAEHVWSTDDVLAAYGDDQPLPRTGTA
jgi:hypothetical protein